MAPLTGTKDSPIEVSTIPPVVGINFGNSYASIAVFTKEGHAESIANEDGERQIACAVSFHGDEMYIGNQAKQQLVKNADNTITGFRNLLGKKFSEISQKEVSRSAPVIQHPSTADEPAYKVQVGASDPKERILTVSEVATIFVKSLIKSAEDFMGKKVQGAVITIPSEFNDVQKEALQKVATDAGVTVLQLLEESGAVAVTTCSDLWPSDVKPDRVQLVVDVGSSSLFLSLISISDGLAHVLASSSSTEIGADQIDDKLIKMFATEFTKKTRISLDVCPSTEVADKRAEAKLRLAVEHTKRTLSASSGPATCSVESLKEGMDYTGSINRMRFDMLARPIYTAVGQAVSALLTSAEIDSHHVHEIVYVGGTASLPGLDEHIVESNGFSEDIITPFTTGTLVGGGVGDPTTILARGCAVQAALIASLDDEELKKAFLSSEEVPTVSKTIGLLFPDESGSELGGYWVPVLLKETPLPARRIVPVEVALTAESKKFAFEVWEVKEGIRIEKVKPPKVEMSDDEDEEEEEEEIEVKHQTITKETLLGVGQGEAKLGMEGKGPKNKGKWSTTLEARITLQTTGGLDVQVKEVGKDGEVISFSV